jgi:hypothetical protein
MTGRPIVGDSPYGRHVRQVVVATCASQPVRHRSEGQLDMRKYLKALALASAFALTADMAAAQTSAQTAPGANLSAYRTYEWAATAPPAGANPIIVQQIIADFDAEMASRGYQKGQPGDLTLVLTLGSQDKTDIQTWGRFGLQTSVYQYTEGQMSLDVFDTKTQHALWHGQVSKTINPKKPDQSKISKAIDKLMTKFPGTAAPAQ